MQQDYNFDTSSLYKFLKDALYEMKEGSLSASDYAECAQVLEQELTKNFQVTRIMKEYSYSQEEIAATDKYIGKEVVVKNMSAIFEILGIDNKRRVQSIMADLKNEIDNGVIENNVVTATDYLDTVWIFDVLGHDAEKIYLQFTGTAK